MAALYSSLLILTTYAPDALPAADTWRCCCRRGRYSWLLGSTVNFVYSFGFVLMTPQLFINYKLKSTAHMPWKVCHHRRSKSGPQHADLPPLLTSCAFHLSCWQTLIYKSLNTFIDDLFAFIIKMPTMHRISCLRDDLIFFIYLYQRWQYGVDAKRANEYGQVERDEGEPGAPAEAIADRRPPETPAKAGKAD